MDGRDPSRSEASRGHVGNVRSPSDGRDLHRGLLNIGRCRQVVEEPHDRVPIGQRLSHDLTSFVAESLQPDQTAADRDPGPRLMPDRGPIVPRSGLFLKQNSSRFIPNMKPQCRSVQTAPTTP